MDVFLYYLFPDISKWDISHVNSLRVVFQGCTSLISLPDISKWNISNVTSLQGMFDYCLSLNSFS